MKKILALIILLLTISVNAYVVSDVPTGDNMRQQYNKIISYASSNYKYLLAVDMAWRDTAKIIRQAEKTFAAGNMIQAFELANKAYQQTINAKKQAAAVKFAGPRF